MTYKWVTGFTTPIGGVTIQLLTSRGPPCINLYLPLLLRREDNRSENSKNGLMRLHSWQAMTLKIHRPRLGASFEFYIWIMIDGHVLWTKYIFVICSCCKESGVSFFCWTTLWTFRSGEGGRCNGATISINFWGYFGATQPILMRVSETYSCMIGSITSRLALVCIQDWFCMMNSTSFFWLVSFNPWVDLSFIGCSLEDVRNKRCLVKCCWWFRNPANQLIGVL